jgi:hypothetical protein
MVDTTFYFAEYTVEGTLPMDYDINMDRNERINESLRKYVNSSGPVVDDKSGTWYFGRVDDEYEYLIGKFGRVYSDEPTTYDEERGDFIDDTEPNQEADYSMFILHLERQLLIYHTKYRVGHKQFRKYFSEGYRNRMGGNIHLDINYIHNEQDVDAIVEEYPVLNAEFELEPSNPSSHPAWDDLDEEIKKMLARKLGIYAESKEGTDLNFDEELLREIYEMSKSEYGEYEIIYNDQGQIKTVTSASDEPVQKGEERPDSLERLKSRTSDLIAYATSFRN